MKLALACLLLLAGAPHPALRGLRPQDDAAPAEASAQLPRPGLAIPHPTPEVSLAMAIQEVREGRTGEALARLAQLEGGPLAERAQRERGRIEAWVALRDAWLGELVVSGKKLSHTHAGKRLRLVVEGIEGGRLRVAENKGGLTELAVEELDPEALAQQIGKTDLAEPWVRLYPYVLAQNTKWKRLLKDDDPGSAALRADAEGDYPARLATGRAAFELEALAAVPTPTTRAQGEAVLARIDALRGELGEVALVVERTRALRSLAAEAHGARFDELGPGIALQGSLEALGDDRYRLHYEFDEAAELADWTPIDTYMKSYRRQLGDVEEGLQSPFEVKSGKLRGRGGLALRHVAEFAAPLTVSWKVTWDRPKKQLSGPSWFFVGMCDDAQYSFAWTGNIGDLEVWDDREVVRAQPVDPEKERTLSLGKSYELSMHHDGAGEEARVRVERNGELRGEVPCPKLGSGAVFLYMQSCLRVQVNRLTIDGLLTEEGLGSLRTDWIERQLADF